MERDSALDTATFRRRSRQDAGPRGTRFVNALWDRFMKSHDSARVKINLREQTDSDARRIIHSVS